MKQFACGMMIPGCDALWVCASEEEILTQAAQHAAEDHHLDGDRELVERVRTFIATAA